MPRFKPRTEFMLNSSGVNLTPATDHYQSGCSPYLCVTPAGVLYTIAINGNADIFMYKSSDNGYSWDSVGNVNLTTCVQFALWYDEWSGISGGLIHMVYTDSVSDDVLYRNFDVDTDTLGTEVTVFAGASWVSGGQLSIVRARGGNLVVVYDIDGGTERGAKKSTDVGATWAAAISDPTEAAADYFLLAPGWNADSQDVMLYYWDISADELSVKRYDDSADTWTETSISTGMVESARTASWPPFAFTVDTANSRNVVIAWNGTDVANQDLKCWWVDDTTITAKTDVVTNATDDCGLAAIGIDTDTGLWYAYYAGKDDGSETYPTSMTLRCRTSSDSGATWSAAQDLTYDLGTTRCLHTALRAVGHPWCVSFRALSNFGGTNRIMIALPVVGYSTNLQVGM